MLSCCCSIMSIWFEEDHPKKEYNYVNSSIIGSRCGTRCAQSSDTVMWSTISHVPGQTV